MVQLENRGLIRHIGVPNFNKKKLEELISNSDVIPEMNQIELHPYLHQDDLVDFCHKHSINITAFSPLGGQDRIEATKAGSELSLLGNKVVAAIARKHDLSSAQILIKFHLERHVVIIPKSINKEKIQENLASQKLNLEEDDLKNLKSIDDHYRYVNGKFFEPLDGKYSNIYDE